jgi:hypothetical protein
MTGPDHYREAEELLGTLARADRGTYPGEEGIVAEAQVHAILALAGVPVTIEPWAPLRRPVS